MAIAVAIQVAAFMSLILPRFPLVTAAKAGFESHADASDFQIRASLRMPALRAVMACQAGLLDRAASAHAARISMAFQAGRDCARSDRAAARRGSAFRLAPLPNPLAAGLIEAGSVVRLDRNPLSIRADGAGHIDAAAPRIYRQPKIATCAVSEEGNVGGGGAVELGGPCGGAVIGVGVFEAGIDRRLRRSALSAGCAGRQKQCAHGK